LCHSRQPSRARTVCLNAPTHDSFSGTDLPAGISTPNAKLALSFDRQRHGLLRGDLDREVRQQCFLSTELHKGIDLLPATGFRAEVGRGVTATVAGFAVTGALFELLLERARVDPGSAAR
jgi:anionic cell wall polymer biosynthesis LytR-Cps2A-Psr (LCP) family protein